MLVSLLILALAGPLRAATPKAGDAAVNFSLNTLTGESIELTSLLKGKPVLLIVLRGWPGYQCPLCTAQVHEFVARAADFAAQGAQVLMVYPGPAKALKEHAREFLEDKQWPKDFIFVIDPDYSFTNQYGLRWDAEDETAYPSTFVIDRTGTIGFAHISHSHGDRVSPAEALEALRAAK